MRRSLSRVAALLVVLVLFSGPRAAAADPGTSGPAAPAALAMSTGGNLLAAGGWIGATKLQLQFQAQVTAGKLTPEVEVQTSDTAFTGKATFRGTPLSASGIATVVANGLANGKTYHWQARLVDDSGNAGPWAAYAAATQTGPDFGVDLDPPSRPIIRSSTDPNPQRWYHNQAVRLSWMSHDAFSGVRGYSYALERNSAHVIPPGTITPATGAQVSHLADGTWFLALRAVDQAGNWSPTATFRIQLDRLAPQITWLSPSRFTFNPYQGSATVRFRVSKASDVNVQIFRVGDRSPTATFSYHGLRAGQEVSLSWSGMMGRGRMAPKGYYFFHVLAIDRAGNVKRVNFGGIDLSPQRPVTEVGGIKLYPGGGKRILVVLSQQALYAYDGTRLVLRTLVTTGNAALPTPVGTYHIIAKYHPFEFISPWPPGSPYWYAPSWTQFAMLFQSQGYFIHDAPWRNAFGPGTNVGTQPGTDFGGTHGCVNVPASPMTFLWSWTPGGTEVDVVP